MHVTAQGFSISVYRTLFNSKRVKSRGPYSTHSIYKLVWDCIPQPDRLNCGDCENWRKLKPTGWSNRPDLHHQDGLRYLI